MALHPFPASQTLQHLRQAEARGLVAVLEAAARRRGVRPAVLLAIASRETHLGQMPPLTRAWTSPDGHGRGVLQIDDRSHAAFVNTHRNDDHAAHADYAAAYLAGLIRTYSGDYTRALAAYNAGPGRLNRVLRAGGTPDSATQGGDYAVDVLTRARTLEASGASAGASSKGIGWGTVGMVAASVGVLFDPTLGALSGLGLGVLAKAQAEGRIA